MRPLHPCSGASGSSGAQLLDWHDFADWPTPLGALPCESSLAELHLLQHTDPGAFLGLGSESVDGQDMLVCAAVSRRGRGDDD